MLLTVGAGLFPQRAHAKGVVNAIVAFVAAPLVLLDPLTSLVIADAFTCQINIIWGCDKNGAPLPEPKPTVTVTAPATVELPNAIAISWSADARAVSCFASGSWSGAKDLSGSEIILSSTTPAMLGNNTFTLSCRNSEGGAGVGSAVTTVIGPVVSITPPTVVEAPNPVSLNWTSQNTVSCVASGEWSGNKGTSGTQNGPATTPGSHTYGLTCINGSNYSAATSVTTNVIGPSVTFNSPTTVEVPAPIILEWTSQNTVSCVASGEWSGNKGTSGSETLIAPTNTGVRGTHTYNLDCVNGSNYPASASVDVVVIQVPKCTFGSDPAIITPPQSSQLSWSCDYATSCSINRGIGSVNPVSGTRTVLPSTTTNYTLSCQGVDGTRTFPATVGIPGTGGVPFSTGATTSPRIIEVKP